jgi:hypothetical protein
MDGGSSVYAGASDCHDDQIYLLDRAYRILYITPGSPCYRLTRHPSGLRGLSNVLVAATYLSHCLLWRSTRH